MDERRKQTRVRLLALEKEAAALHRMLSGELQVHENLEAEELAGPLRHGLWLLGVTVLQIAHAQQRA